MKVSKAIEVLEGAALQSRITADIDDAIDTVVEALRKTKFGNKQVPTAERQRGRNIVNPITEIPHMTAQEADRIIERIDQAWESDSMDNAYVAENW